MKRSWRDYGLSITLIALFLISWTLQTSMAAVNSSPTSRRTGKGRGLPGQMASLMVALIAALGAVGP